MSYGISSTDYKGTINQIENIFSQFGGCSFQGSSYINSIFGVAGSVAQIASGDPNQQGAGVQNLISQAMALVEKLINPAAEATSRVAKDGEGAKEVEKSAEEIKAELNASMEEASKEIGKQTEIVTNAKGEIVQAQEELQAKQAEVEKNIQKIQELQAKFEGASTQEKIDLLKEIEGLGQQIIDLLANIGDLQKIVTDASADVETALIDIETAKGNAVERQEDGQIKITTAVQDAAQTTGETVETGVDGQKNEVLGAELETLAAGEAATVVGIAAAVPTAEKGAELITAGGIEIAGTALNLRSLLKGIGGVAGNTELLATFKNAIGGALGGFNNAIGGWNEFITPVITSLGTLSGEAGYAAQAEALKAVVKADYKILGVESTSDSQQANDTENFDFMAAQERDFRNENILAIQPELNTPKFQFKSFGI